MIARNLFAALMLAASAGSAIADPPKLLSEDPAIVREAKQYRLRDEATGLDYVIRIAEPSSPPPVGAKAPVIYVLDGNWYFGLATDIARMLPIGTKTPAAAIVAIGYPEQTFEDQVKRREQDFMFRPFADRPDVGGGGAAFQRFLLDDLRPFIEQRHGLDPQRAYLAGQSLGGQFAANVLLNKPDSFTGYLIGSPSMWADATILPVAKTFTNGGSRRVMVGVGAQESPLMLNGAASLADALSRPKSGLAVLSRRFDNQHHMSMHGAWFAEGFRYLLDGPDK